MMPFLYYLRRLPRTMMFWLFVAVVVAFGLRLAFPREGFDQVDVGDTPLDVAGAEAGVWVLNYEEHSVSLIDPAEVELVFTASVGDDVAPALAADGHGAWVLVDQATTLALVDPVDQEITERIDVEAALDGAAQDLAAGAGYVWLTSGASGRMAQVDPGTGEVLQTVDVDQNVVQPQIVGESLWIVRSDGLAEYDVETGEERRVVETDRAARDYAVGEDTVWLLTDIDNEAQQGTVVAVDTESSEETGAVVVGGSRPARMVLVDDGQLVISGSGGRLMQVATDPLEPVAAEQVSLESKSLRGLTLWDGRIWVADGVDAVAYQSVGDVQGEITTGTTIP